MVQTTGPGLFDSGSNNDSLGPSTWTPPPTPVEIPEEAVEAQLAQGDFGGIGSVVAVTSGGLTINLLFDAAAMAAPASFRAGIQQAAALLSAAISDHITINLKIDYSGTGGGAAAGPDSGQWESYTSVRADLINYASPGDTAFNALPSGSTIQGQSSVAVWNAQLKLWGLLSANDTTTDDGSATFATDIRAAGCLPVAPRRRPPTSRSTAATASWPTTADRRIRATFSTAAFKVRTIRSMSSIAAARCRR